MCVGFGQGFKSMSSPVKAIEALVLQKKLNHGNNPVLTWNVSNVQLVSDAADNVKMDKSKAIERIDGAVALAMAIGRAEVYKNEEADWETLIV
jgi:phage terminase large subunit-like protein